MTSEHSTPQATAVNDLILTIDLGSSSVRASAYYTTGAPVEGISEYRYIRQAADSTFDPNTITELTEQVVSDCLERLRELRGEYRFLAVAWTSFAMSWLGVNRNGQPVTPVYSYADTRSGPYADRLRRELQQEGAFDTTYSRTGTPVHSAYVPAQMLRLAAEEPERLGQVAHWHTLASYLLARWKGHPFAPISSSEVGWTGLFNRRARAWDEALLRRVGLAAHNLSPILDYSVASNQWPATSKTPHSTAVTGPRPRAIGPAIGLAAPWARRWPELATVPFFLAVGDGVGANLGSGCTDNRRIALTIGTTGAMRVVIPTDMDGSVPEVPVGLWSYPIDRKRWLLGGSLTDGGSLYSWLQDVLAAEEPDERLALAALLPPDAHGLTILPFLRGERAPGWASEATLSISGITPATTAAHIIRAAFEAVAFRFRLIYDRLKPLLAPDSEIVASGGALQENLLWRQILADVLQTPVHLIDVPEATSRGAAILALQALGLPEPPVPPTVHTSTPDRQASKRYEKAMRRQEELYRQLIRFGDAIA